MPSGVSQTRSSAPAGRCLTAGATASAAAGGGRRPSSMSEKSGIGHQRHLPAVEGRGRARRARRSPRRRTRRRRRTSAPGPARRGTPARRRPPAAPRRRPRPARRRARRWSTGTATVAPLPANASRPRPRRPSPASTASMPPAWKRLRGEARRGRCARPPGPSVARKTAGRAPVAARCASERSRSASNASSRRTRGSPPAGAVGRGAARATGVSSRSGNSLTPVIGSRRCGQRRRARRSQVAASRVGDQPGVAARRPAPPAASISWNNAQAARGELVGEPLDVPGAAGRVDHPGQVRLLDQDRLGVAGDPPGERRRAGPSASSNGSTVTASAPPTPAAKQATVRAQHVHPRVAAGHHRRRGDRVLALAPAPGAPQTSATRAHSRRAARSLAIVGNWSAVAAYRNSSWPQRRVDGQPGVGQRPQVGDPGRQRAAQLLRRREPPASWYGSASTVTARSRG